MARKKSNRKDLAPPKATLGDKAHKVIGTLISAALGGSGSGLFNFIVEPPLKRRLENWRETVGTGLARLSEQVEDITPDKWAEDEAFVSVVSQASRAALATHREEKLAALRAAVLNAAAGTEPDEDAQAMFINLIDEFQPWHLRLLKFYADPAKAHRATPSIAKSRAPSSITSLLEECLPHLRGQRDFYVLLTRNLQSRGLVENFELNVIMTSTGTLVKRTTDLGDRFLEFITSPLDDDGA